MLVYHPAYDAYHCIFRILSILDVRASLDMDMLRLLDYALCFPVAVADFRLPGDMYTVKKMVRDSGNLYRSPLNQKATFAALAATQEGALVCLAAAGFVAQDELQKGRVTRTGVLLPSGIAARRDNFKKTEAIFFNHVMKAMLSFPLQGEGGLKDRSGLMEYRYDFVAAQSSAA
jgi:hypothetical protein